MAYVCEKSFLRLDHLHHFQGFRKTEMREVWFNLQGVKHKYFGALQFPHGFFWDEVSIGDIAEISKAESENRQLQVKDWQRNYGGAINREGLIIDLVERQLWQARIMIFNKRIRKICSQLIKHGDCSVCRNLHLLHKIKSTNVVQPGRVIAMGVGEHQSVDTFDILTQHLLTKIWTRIDHKILTIDIYLNRCAKSLVPELE